MNTTERSTTHAPQSSRHRLARPASAAIRSGAPSCSLKARPAPQPAPAPSWEELLGQR